MRCSALNYHCQLKPGEQHYQSLFTFTSDRNSRHHNTDRLMPRRGGRKLTTTHKNLFSIGAYRDKRSPITPYGGNPAALREGGGGPRQKSQVKPTGQNDSNISYPPKKLKRLLPIEQAKKG